MELDGEDNLNKKGLSFFIIILPIPTISHHLQVPKKFIKHIQKSAYRKATLRGPSGCCWPVKLHKNSKGVFIKDGWSRFFKAHYLGHFEFVLFNYDGKMCFDVSIYGSDGLKRAQVPVNSEPIYVIHGSGDKNETITPNEEAFDAKSDREATMINGRIKRGRYLSYEKDGPDQNIRDKSRKMLESGDEYCSPQNIRREIIEISDDEMNYPSKEFENQMINQSQNFIGNEINPAIEEAYNVKRKSYSRKRYLDVPEFTGEGLGFQFDEIHRQYFSRKVPPTELKYAFFSGKDYFNSRFPFFQRYVNICSVKKKYMFNISRDFVQRYFHDSASVKLRREGKSWEVNIKMRKITPYFSAGWFCFFDDNELKLGDLCVFELVKELEMQVHIFRSPINGNR